MLSKPTWIVLSVCLFFSVEALLICISMLSKPTWIVFSVCFICLSRSLTCLYIYVVEAYLDCFFCMFFFVSVEALLVCISMLSKPTWIVFSVCFICLSRSLTCLYIYVVEAYLDCFFCMFFFVSVEALLVCISMLSKPTWIVLSVCLSCRSHFFVCKRDVHMI